MSDPKELRSTGLKVTAPRLRVLDLFQTSSERHLTAEDVYRRLLEENADIGLATALPGADPVRAGGTTLSKRLKLRGMKVDAVHDGQQALDYIAKREPDVMVLDLKMPGLSGMEVLRSVSKTNPNLQVIILTGHGSAREEQEARSLNAFDYLTKPTEIDTLANCIRAAHRYRMTEKPTARDPADAGDDIAKRVAKDRESLKMIKKDEK